MDAEPNQNPERQTVHLRFTDLDYQGHVTATAYLAFFEQARAAWLAALWQSTMPSYVVVRQQIEYLSELRLDHSPVTITVRAVDVRRSSFDIKEELTVTAGHVMARSAATLLSFDRHERRHRPLAHHERAALERSATG